MTYRKSRNHGAGRTRAHGFSQGVALKKKFGQHFLRDDRVIQSIIDEIDLKGASVFEIGCGDGVLTQAILQCPVTRLWVFEIDADWVTYIQKTMTDERLTVYHQNILDFDFVPFKPHAPWILLANLPYQVTFPILYTLHARKDLIEQGVIMVQEEVAQKIIKRSGRGYGFPSLFFQHYFDWKPLNKVPPSSFYPPPQVDSRLLYFRTKKIVEPIPEEPEFWKFIKAAFHQPRRTLKNNLTQYHHFDISGLSEQTLSLRAQQMSMEQLLALWNLVHHRARE